MYIQLDIGWLRHPFPVSSFRIGSAEQIRVLQNLGIQSIRCIPAKSDPAALNYLPLFTNEVVDFVEPEMAADFGDERAALMKLKLPGMGAHASPVSSPVVWSDDAALQACDQRFSAATHGYRQVLGELVQSPEEALQTGTALVSGYIAELLDSPYTTIRLLSESVGEQQGAHSVNVTLLSLMLGKAQGLDSAQLLNLGLAALLHDVGKVDLDPRCKEALPSLTEEQQGIYESHVGASVAYGLRMGLSPAALTAIAQHHEMADGSGFPLRLLAEDLSVEGQILALTNCYDKMCNPLTPVTATTPHEALSTLFAQRRGAFSREMIELFVRVMGVYPPGSIVQLSDERYGLVVSVHSAHPLKPRLVLYSAEVPRQKAQPIDMSELEGIVVKRSIRPSQLPREVLNYLSPRKRVCYFFERAVGLLSSQGAA